MVDGWMEEPADLVADDLPAIFRDPMRFTAVGRENVRTAVQAGATPNRGVSEYVCDLTARPDQERARVARIIRDASLRKFMAREGPLPCKVTVVRERGFKARVVTKSPADVVEVGHLLRSIVWPMLTHDERVNAAIEGGRLETVFTSFLEEPLEVPIALGDLAIVSADLTKATDGLTRDAIFAVWDGVCEGAGLGDDVAALGRRILGPMSIDYDGVLPNVEETARGCLMGLPLSWFILSIINIWAASLSISDACHQTGLPGKWNTAMYVRFATCGDDLLAVMPTRAHFGYESRIAAVGSGLSIGKHLVSSHLALFTEQMAWFRHEEGPVPTETLQAYVVARKGRVIPDAWKRGPSRLVADHLIDYVPVRSIVHPGHFAVKRVSGPSKFEMPSWATSGPAISSAIPAWSSVRTRKTVHRLTILLRPECGMLIRAGIPAFIPRSLGGGGFPASPVDHPLKHCPGFYRRFLFAILRRHDVPTLEDGKVLRRLVNQWRCSGVAGDILEGAIEEAILEFEQLKLLTVPDEVGRLADRLACTIDDHVTSTTDDAVLRLASVWAPALSIAGFSEGRGYCSPFWKFRRQWFKTVVPIAKRITGSGRLLRETKPEVLEQELRELCAGPVVFLPRESIPPGLGVSIIMTPFRFKRKDAGLHREIARSSCMEQPTTSTWAARAAGE
jgi:hypothetical protein